MNIEIRTADEADLGELAALVNSAYRGDSSRAGWTTEADLIGGQRTDVETLRSALSHSVILTLRSETQGPIKACVALEEKPGNRFYLGMLTVHPAEQSSGFGRRLLQQAEQFAAERGARAMTMTVISVRTELIAWYERCGYARTGETQPFPYGDLRFGEPKVQDLQFDVLRKELSSSS